MESRGFLSHSMGESLQHRMKAPREEGMMSVASKRMDAHWAYCHTYYLCNQVADGKKEVVPSGKTQSQHHRKEKKESGIEVFT